MYLVISRDSDNTMVRIHFPATLEEVQHGLSQFDGYGASDGPVQIVGTSSYADRLANYIRYVDLNSEANIEKLNQLAERVNGMDEWTERVFSAALDAEGSGRLDDALRIASSLSQYEYIEGVTSDKELGGWLVEHGLAGVDFPEQVRPYLDYAGIGAAYYSDHGGAYTAHGYVKRREAVQAQTVEDKPDFTLTLVTAVGSCRLNFPVSDDDLERARQRLGVDDLRDAIIGNVEIDYPWAHLLPMESISVDDANTLAQYARSMSFTEQRTFGAALEAEEPDYFSKVLCIAEDIDDYELVDDTEGEYARDALRRAGAGDEIFDLLDGYTDYERLGQAMMEEDGVQTTSFGSIKRLSVPFSQQPDMGQVMY